MPRLQWRPLLIAGLLATLIFSVGLTIFFAQRLTRSRQSISDQVLGNEAASITPPSLSQEELAAVDELNVLILGYGGPGHSGGYLTDVIQVLHFDFQDDTVTFISIPRDLWVRLPNGQEAKINQAFTLGSNPDEYVASGAEVSKIMAEFVTGLPIHYYAAVDFVGFKRLMGEVLDGVVVDVPETLEDPWYPISGKELDPCGHSPEEIAELTANLSGFELEKQFECRYEHLYFPAGPVAMEGHEALAYVRSRHGSSAGDFSRSQRQQALLKGVRDKALQLGALDDWQKFFIGATDEVKTDLDLAITEELLPLARLAVNYQTDAIVLSTENVFVNGRSGNGQFILQPRESWQAVRDYVAAELQ